MLNEPATGRSLSSLEYSQKIISVYRGWEAFERARSGPHIIDFDLTHLLDTARFDSRMEILAALERLVDDLDDASQEGVYLRDKMLGSTFYLRALLGQQIPFPQYVQHTLGFAIKPFTDEEIKKARIKVNMLLSPFGIQLEPKYKAEFDARLTIKDPEEIKRGITGNQELWLSRLREQGIPTPKRFDLHVEFVEVDAYWSNWISGSVAEGVRLRINLHSRRKYESGRPLALCLHEICGHAMQMLVWRDLIAQGVINPACGLTTVHSPECFVSEGLGQTVADFLGEEAEFPPEFWLSRSLQYYNLMVLNNAHLMIYDGAPIEEIFRYVQSRLPFFTPLAIEAELRDRAANPLYRAYQLSYAAAEHMITGLTRSLTPQQRRRFLVELYLRPMTPKQLQQFVERLKE